MKPGGCSGLILHFDELSVLSLSKETALFTPIQKSAFGAAERMNNDSSLDR
jgi:hypothetical protein